MGDIAKNYPCFKCFNNLKLDAITILDFGKMHELSKFPYRLASLTSMTAEIVKIKFGAKKRFSLI